MRDIPKEKRKLILVIAAISFCQGLQYVLSPVLGQIQKAYPDVPVDTVQMLITSPMLVSMVVALISGWLVLRITKKKLLIFAGLICGIPGMVPMVVDSFPVLMASRLVYGVGLGLTTTLNTAVVAEHFEGRARTVVMGLQGGLIGLGMMIANTFGGLLGNFGWQAALWLHLIGVAASVVMAILLPETGLAAAGTEKVRLTWPVFKTAILCVVQFTFLLTFSTNIAMHIGGDSSTSGLLTGLFAGVQILAGVVFASVAKRTRQLTLPCAMGCIAVGAALLAFLPDFFPALILGALLFGMAQGIFVPRAMCEGTEAVSPASSAMAAAVITLGLNLGAGISPYVANALTGLVWGQVTTGNVYFTAAAAMAVFTVLAALWKRKDPALV